MLVLAALLACCSDAPARCRAEVAASFEQLRTSGTPYRKETAITVSDYQSFLEIAEYIPPDRMRSITTNRMREHEAHGIRLPANEINSEVIRVGARAWGKAAHTWGNEQTGWQEWDPKLVQELFGAGMDFLLFPDRVIPAGAAFECLGEVAFRDDTDDGYRTRLDKSVAYNAPTDPKERKALETSVRKQLWEMPQEWRTVFVDKSSGLPVYDMVAAADRLDTPRHSVHYTYAADMKIDPPAP